MKEEGYMSITVEAIQGGGYLVEVYKSVYPYDPEADGKHYFKTYRQAKDFAVSYLENDGEVINGGQ